MSGEDLPVGFKPGLKLLEEEQSRGLVPVEAYVVSPVMSVKDAIRNWDTYLELKRLLLDDPNCVDIIAGSKEMNRTGATRLATAFGLSLETLRVDEAQMNEDTRFIVRVRASRGPRYADGVASCRLSEIDSKVQELSKREHFALTRAATRATKRAIADILGGTEAE